MDNSGEVADLMVKESIQITEAAIKMLAGGSKNLAAFLLALSRDDKKLYGKTNMKKLLKMDRGLAVFHIREEDLDDFREYAKKQVLFSAVKDTRSSNGIVSLVTNSDYVPLVNRYLELRGYPAPVQEQEDSTPKKAVPRVPPEPFSPQRGNGWTVRQRTDMDMETITDKPSVRARLAGLRAASESMRGGRPRQRSPQQTK